MNNMLIGVAVVFVMVASDAQAAVRRQVCTGFMRQEVGSGLINEGRYVVEPLYVFYPDQPGKCPDDFLDGLLEVVVHACGTDHCKIIGHATTDHGLVWTKITSAIKLKK